MSIRLSKEEQIEQVRHFLLDAQLHSLLKLIINAADTQPEVWKGGDNEAPRFASILLPLQLLKKQKRLSVENVRFILESYLFIVKRPSFWKTITYFAGGFFALMNIDIEAFMKNKSPEKLYLEEASRPWFKLITSPDLPIIPEELTLARCCASDRHFNIANQNGFDVYRATSTTLFEKGHCTGDGRLKPNAYLQMFIRCKAVRGLFISFPGMALDEGEIVLPPGIKFDWNKTATHRVPRHAMNSDALLMPGEFVQATGDEELKDHWRAYDVSFIQAPVESKFSNQDVAHRVQLLQKGIEKVNALFMKEKQARAHARILKFIQNQRLKIQQARDQAKNKAGNESSSEDSNEEAQTIVEKHKTTTRNQASAKKKATSKKKAASKKKVAAPRKKKATSKKKVAAPRKKMASKKKSVESRKKKTRSRKKKTLGEKKKACKAKCSKLKAKK